MQHRLQYFPIKIALSCLIACLTQMLYAENAVTEVQKLAPIIVQATRTDRERLSTPASVYYLNQEQQNSLNVNLSETLRVFQGYSSIIVKTMPKICKFQCVALVPVPVLGYAACVYMSMEFRRPCRMGRGKPRILT